MISISTCQDKSKANTTKFKQYKPESIDDIAMVIIARIWSPIIWTNGIRAATNFISSDYLTLDFDSGEWTLSDAEKFAKDLDLSFILATTKSHQRMKTTATGSVSLPCDRFRMIIPFDGTIKDLDTYIYNLKAAFELIPADKSCSDGARLFFPCTQIVATSEGKKWPIVEVPIDQTTEAIQKRRAEYAEKYKSVGMLPSWVCNALRHGTSEGGRHKMCYKIGAMLQKFGKSVDEIISLCMRSPLSQIGERDVERAVTNGFNKAEVEG